MIKGMFESFSLSTYWFYQLFFRQNFINHCSYVCQLDLSRSDMDVALMKITCSHHSSFRQIVKSDNHYIALSNDNRVYSWGEGSNGELGHGPETISLKNAKITKILTQ